ncbi:MULTISPECIES: CC0125/CC1285 family lipoprotein [unclassified Brevundimonas]|uniref:CC0125/CC1285 family lipoprotein n=1 Tax=unclassified Brevundimonas TaxID=2622653 RepID=UPI0025C18145|nr:MULTISPECIES: hypothetical protein [unclassified Brevundimonas]
MKIARKTPVLLALAGALTVAACASTATPYQPAGLNGQRGGYAEQRLEQNRFRVSFAGNSVTSRDQVEMSLLLRAAELTVENGFDWFATVDRATERDTRFYAQPDPFYYDRYSPFWGPRWRFYHRGAWSPWDPYWGRNVDVRQVDRYEATTEIVMGRGQKPSNDANAFDARDVISNLSARVTRPVS